MPEMDLSSLLAVLVCPVCHEKLETAAEGTLRCRGCGRRYPVEDGIPVMLEERASGGTKSTA
jgi:hypothetical protein